jgi:hypothetical protein
MREQKFRQIQTTNPREFANSIANERVEAIVDIAIQPIAVKFVFRVVLEL